MCDRKQKLIIIAGPTATGKTALGVRLAGDVDGEIISADSMQVYRGMDIGTAKATEAERGGIPHHMLDVVNPGQPYSIADYKETAKGWIRDISGRGKLPIVVGGTGFYIHALLYDTDFSESDNDEAFRKNLETLAQERGPEYLHKLLAQVDPESAEAIHANNRKRVIRALEFYHLTGEKISVHNRREHAKESPYDFLFIVLCRDQGELYHAIDARVDDMMTRGLYDEAMRLKEAGIPLESPAMQGIGYKEFYENADIATAVDRIKQNSHHYVKRQMTWFNREKKIHRIAAPVSEEDYQWIVQQCIANTESVTGCCR